MTTLKTISDVAKAQSVETESKPVSPSNGLVGFFDILGYKSLLLNNEIPETISIIKDAFIRAPAKLAEDLGTLKDIKPYFVPEHVVFSDSILVYAPFGDPEYKALGIEFFLSYCRQVVGRLFLRGLPLRGAIAVGEYYVEGASFAGKPIVEAFELSNALQLAGCAITPSGEKEILASQAAAKMLVQHPVPLKSLGKQNLFMLDYLPAIKNPLSRQWVIERFEAHNKRVSLEVIDKVNHTIELLEKCSGRKD
jgi:hypothetical protein